jgi:hypothetical protein
VKPVAALFVDPRGHYPSLAGVDCWGEDRDARNYTGPHPVVAHPPCQLWTNFSGLNFIRYGGAHNRPGNDHGCFARALDAVMRFGGVLEHPARSHAWDTFGLPKPGGRGWTKHRFRGQWIWVCEVWQTAFGHKAKKPTWLVYRGRREPLEARWDRRPGTHQIGWFDRLKPTLGKREASATPLPFAEYLIALARAVR